MKIAHILWGLDYGGIETMVVNIAGRQAAQGHDVTLFVIDRAIAEPLAAALDSRVSLRRINRPKGSRNPLYPLRLNLQLLRFRPDVVHFHSVNLGRLVAPPLKRRRCTTHHSTWRPELHTHFGSATPLVAISHHAAKDIFDHTGVRTTVIENGIDSGTYTIRQSRKPDSPLKVAQVGRINYAVKGQDITLAALKLLRERGIDVHVDFIGDGPDLEKLRRDIAEASLEDRAKADGPRTQSSLQAGLSDYDLVIQPSRIEGFGLTVAEAMASGVPVAVASLPALREVVDGGECGMIFDADNPVSLADTIARVARGEVDPLIAGRALERVKRLYDVDITTRRYLDFYKTL